MDDIFVGRLMSSGLQTVAPDTLVEDAAQRILENEIGSLVVVDEDNQLLGILTTTDFVNIVARSQPKAETTVERYMTADVVTTNVQESVQNAADTMLRHGFHHLPVVDEEEGLVGIVTTTDLAAYIADIQTPSPS